MITFISGDILQSKEQFIAQGVATGLQEGLGTGLALKISKKWPELQKAFKKHARANGFKSGDVFIAQNSDDKIGIIYIATQPDMYHAELNYLNKGIKNLMKICEINNIKSVALPKIGSGLGKLNWESQVKPILISILESSRTQFMIYEFFTNQHEIDGL
ncbi:MAG: macro domain-containing protein [Bacteroidetes Order II. Incertae sedis bacterium]|nr:macro domain-containing protein [Bacteroidetes Order II. bacterium]